MSHTAAGNPNGIRAALKMSSDDIRKTEVQSNREHSRRVPFANKPLQPKYVRRPLGPDDCDVEIAEPCLPIAQLLHRFGFAILEADAGQVCPQGRGDHPRVTMIGQQDWAVEMAKLAESYAYEKAVDPMVLSVFFEVWIDMRWNRVAGRLNYTMCWHDMLSMLDFTKWIQDRLGRADDETEPRYPVPPRGIPVSGIRNIMRRRNR